MSPTAKAVDDIADHQAHMEGVDREAAMVVHHPRQAFTEVEGLEDLDMVQHEGPTDLRMSGLWRIYDEWGLAYPEAMTDWSKRSGQSTAACPVPLMSDEYDIRLHGISDDDAVAFEIRRFPDDVVEMTRADELRIERQPAPADGSLLF